MQVAPEVPTGALQQEDAIALGALRTARLSATADAAAVPATHIIRLVDVPLVLVARVHERAALLRNVPLPRHERVLPREQQGHAEQRAREHALPRRVVHEQEAVAEGRAVVAPRRALVLVPVRREARGVRPDVLLRTRRSAVPPQSAGACPPPPAPSRACGRAAMAADAASSSRAHVRTHLTPTPTNHCRGLQSAQPPRRTPHGSD